jgi:hypothetical protein
VGVGLPGGGVVSHLASALTSHGSLLGYGRRMTIERLRGMDFGPGEQPEPDPDFRTFLEAFFRYQRHEFLRKLRDLDSEGLVKWSVPPVELSVLGLVRHMTQMEHVYLAWGLGGGERHMVYGDDDYAGATSETIDEDLDRYFAEVDRADAAIEACDTLDTVGRGHRRPLGATLVKMIDEYALHAGQAHMLRFAALGEVRR